MIMVEFHRFSVSLPCFCTCEENYHYKNSTREIVGQTETSMVESGTEREPKMERGRKEGREENEDRLSDLPDCILLHILTFMSTKDVVHTCVLSKRWKDLWKHVHDLQLHSPEFKTLEFFKKFVIKALSFRDDSTPLHNLDFQRLGCARPQSLRRLVRYAISHKVQQLRMSVDLVSGIEIPSTIFSCQSLTSLELSFSGKPLIIPKSLNLKALTNLHLCHVEFLQSEDGQAEPFSACEMLHTLFIQFVTLRKAQVLSISNVRLANLVIRYCDEVDKIVLSTPNLQSFSLTSFRPPKLIESNLSFLDEVYIDDCSYGEGSALILNGWLRAFTNVKSMTLSSHTLEVLSSIPDLQKIQHPCFGNLNSFKVLLKRYAPIPCGILNFLLQNSTIAEVTILHD